MNRLLAIYDYLMNPEMLSTPYDGILTFLDSDKEKARWQKRRQEWLEHRGVIKVLKASLRKWLEHHDPEDWWKFASEEGARLAERLHWEEIDPNEDWVKTQVANYKRLYPFPKEVLNEKN